MPKLTFAQLAQNPVQRPRKEVKVEEWGEGPFYLVEISGKQHEEMSAELLKAFDGAEPGIAAQRKTGTTGAIVLSRCLVDEEGQSPSKDWLMEQPIRILSRLCADAMQLNGLTPEAQATLEKNLPQGDAGSSS